MNQFGKLGEEVTSRKGLDTNFNFADERIKMGEFRG